MPGMADPRFDRAVIAMAVHDENGAVGIGVGHVRAGIRFRDLLRQLDIDPAGAPDRDVLHGGPVEPGRGFVLHSDDWSGQDTIAVVGLGAMTGTIDVLRAIAEGRGPSRWVVALGYAGWGAGQLDEEMTRLRGHFSHWLSLVDSAEPCGRKLDFLVQEMNREINTIGSKAEGTRVPELVVTAKAELERVKEQAQNVE
jgi:putative AlgH/UPF0301 family transcriptional regulator